jgi:hypothetical protein
MMRFVSLRGMLLLGFVVAMPVLALPPVARWMDELLYGPPPTDFGRPPAPPACDGGQPLVAQALATASYSEASPALAADSQGLDAAAAAAPPLAPLPVFAPVIPPQSPPAEAPISEATIARLQEIRQKLENLGADYVVVEALESGGGYRCYCRMLVDPRSRFTRPFEAIAADPLAAAQQALREVEAWRAAAIERREPPPSP